jgi:diketogulonate reductase-like aldo/keto reductase
MENGAQPQVLTRPIPSTGELLPVVGLGTWQAFDVGPSDKARAPLANVLDAFAGLGGKLVDSSPMYGRAEGVVGDLAKKLNLGGKLFLATKVWTSGKIVGLQQMEESLRLLRTDTIDLMQIHNLLDAATHLPTLRKWKEEGRVRYYGITHYTAGAYDQVMRLMRTEPMDFVQINYSVAEREAEEALLPMARDRGLAVLANRPFANGDILRRLRRRALPDWAKEIDCDSWAQLLLKFVISHPAVTCAIPATSDVAHLRDNMKAAYGRMPSETMRARIADAAS